MASTSASTSTSTSSPHRAPQQGKEEEDDDEALFAALEAELDQPELELRQDAGTEHRGFLASGDGSAGDSASASRNGGSGSGGGFDLEGYRERRMREMREDLSSRRRGSSSSSDEETGSANPSEGVGAAEHFGLASSSTGRYLKFTAEKEVIALLEKAAKADTNSSSAEGRGGGGGGSRVVLHFSHPEFARCKIMDGHLERLASAHPSTLFIGISPLSAPFLVRKLRVKVLPHLVCFVEGAARDRLVGFEELGNTDGFRLEVLEERLGMSGVLTPRSRRNAGRPILGFPSAKADDDGDDWD